MEAREALIPGLPSFRIHRPRQAPTIDRESAIKRGHERSYLDENFPSFSLDYFPRFLSFSLVSYSSSILSSVSPTFACHLTRLLFGRGH